MTAFTRSTPEPAMWPVAYAPDPLNLARDWLHRRRNWVRLALAVVLAVWLGPAGYGLWTMRSARPLSGGEEMLPIRGAFRFMPLQPGLNIPAVKFDRTADLMAAIRSLPAEPNVVPSTAPAGQQWVTWKEYKTLQSGKRLRTREPLPTSPVEWNPVVIRSGPWIPNRFQLREAIEYLELPATRAALDHIRELSGQPHCAESDPATPSSGRRCGAEAMRKVALLLVARARYHILAHADFSAAADDIETVLRLAEGMEDDGTFFCLGRAFYRAAAYYEVACWGRERLPTREQAMDLMRRIEAHRRDLPKAWRIAVEGDRRLCLDVLNAYYPSGKPDCYVLHRPGKATGDWVLGSLNLLSPFLANRCEAGAFVSSFCDSWESGDPSPTELARRERITQPMFENPLVPFGINFRFEAAHARELFTDIQADEAGAITAMALAAYYADHRNFPKRLQELVPAYLNKLPADPFSGKPLGYRMHTDGSFILYSVGVDGIDNGGPLEYCVKEQRYLDPIVCQPRNADPDPEWVLVPK